jgi:hypothetical protein
MIEEPKDPADIGGPAPDYRGDEASRPLEEAGQGEAEGFEQAEDALIEEASHGESAYNPEVDAPDPEPESGLATGVSGEPDEVDPTEVVRDPSEGEDDPGQGPGIAADR